MDPQKNDSSSNEQSPEHQAPADALSRTPDDLEQEAAEHPDEIAQSGHDGEKKPSAIKQFLRRMNIYFLFFVLVVIIVAAIAVVNYLNSQKEPPAANISTQPLTQAALKQLANTDASVGNTNQTLTIQGNAVIAGQTLARGDMSVAGTLQSGGSFTAPNMTISGTSNLGTAQMNTLQVASNAAIQGAMTIRDLNVAGTSSFSGAMTASQITVTNLTISGNGVLSVPNHISFSSGPTPGISRGNALGNGGSVSINGSDTSGTINVSTGGSAQPGCYANINFHQAFSGQPRVTIGPNGYGAGVSQYYVGNLSRTGFQICAATPPSSQSFAFDYFVAN